MNTETIADIFDEIYKTGALIISPAEAKEIARCQRDLHDINSPALPSEYIEFLKIANGMAWNGFEFFGTYQAKDTKTGYVLSDIVSFNNKLKANKSIDNRIALGRFDEDIYLYDADKKEYQSIDKLTLIEIDTYSSFEELFVSTVTNTFSSDDEEDNEESQNEEG